VFVTNVTNCSGRRAGGPAGARGDQAAEGGVAGGGVLAGGSGVLGGCAAAGADAVLPSRIRIASAATSSSTMTS
jgi:hypothetical protein